MKKPEPETINVDDTIRRVYDYIEIEPYMQQLEDERNDWRERYLAKVKSEAIQDGREEGLVIVIEKLLDRLDRREEP